MVPKVRVVVLNHNGGDMVVKCLRHALATEWPVGHLQVVCVDNGSVDGSDDAIERALPTVEVRRNRVNLGFPGNNTALADLDGVDLVALVNNDAYVEPGWLRPLVDTIDSGVGIGAACPKILLADRFVEVSVVNEVPGTPVRLRDVLVDDTSVYTSSHTGPDTLGRRTDGQGVYEELLPVGVVRVPVGDRGGDTLAIRLRLEAARPTTVRVDGGAGVLVRQVGAGGVDIDIDVVNRPFDVINNVGSLVFEDGYGADRGYLERDLGQFDRPSDVFAWCGGAVLLSTDYLADVGLFDESYFLYYEDTDLSWRGAMRGWRYRTTPMSIVRHEHSASSVEGSTLFVKQNERNRLMTIAKDGSFEQLARQTVRFATATASYARRDIVRPMLRGERPSTAMVRTRLSAFAGFVASLPATLAARRQVQRNRLIVHRTLRKSLTARPD